MPDAEITALGAAVLAEPQYRLASELATGSGEHRLRTAIELAGHVLTAHDVSRGKEAAQ